MTDSPAPAAPENEGVRVGKDSTLAPPKEISEATEIGKDEWRTYKRADYKRTLPRDVHELLEDIEMMVANVLGSKSRDYSHGRSVEVLTVIVRFLDEHRDQLKAIAEEWN